MDNSYHQVQHMSPPFAYFHSNGKLDVQQSDMANHHANAANDLLYQSQMSQSMQSFNMFSPEETHNSIPFTQLYNSGYPGNIQMSPHYKKENLLDSNIPPNILIQPNLQDGEGFFYPSTPPLSASPSISGSPSDYSALPTPANTIFAIHRSKDDVFSDNNNCPSWINYASPPITPAYVQSGTLNSDGSSHSMIPSQRSTNSPCTSPMPSQLPSEPDVDFCDPRKLIVCPGVNTNSNLGTPESLPNVVHLSSSFATPEDHKLVLPRAMTSRNFKPKETSYVVQQPDFTNLDTSSELDVGDNFLCGFSSFSVPDQTLYVSPKRQRTDSGVSLSNGLVISPVTYQELGQTGSYNQLSVTCPLSPPSSITDRDRKNVKRLKKTKKMTNEISTSSHGSESYESDTNLKAEKYICESTNEGKNTESNETSTSRVPEKSKSSELSKAQHQVTRRGRKQSETEDLTKTFVCESCNRRFKRQEHLKRHYRSVHTQEKPFKCHECGKDFSRSDNLSQHARTHGNGSIVVGLLEEGEITNELDANCEHIGNLGSILFNVAAAAPGSETDRSSQCSSNGSSMGKDVQSRKKHRRTE